jgi:uncharacterized SAM-binding protein YcdF (DUF218 family)
MRFLMLLPLVLMGGGALVGVTVLTAVCICEGMKYPVVASDCILVLGAHVRKDGHMCRTLTHRCEKAIEAWRAGIAPVMIVCGGQGSDEPVPEAHAMRQWFLEHGVPEDRVIIEDASRNTRENLRFARNIMESKGYKTAAICTSDYHLRRALWQAREEGLTACGISAPSSRNIISFTRNRFRETCSWILYFLRRI